MCGWAYFLRIWQLYGGALLVRSIENWNEGSFTRWLKHISRSFLNTYVHNVNKILLKRLLYAKYLLYTNICTNKWCKYISKLLRRVSVLIRHLQGVYKLCQLKLWIIKVIKYNIVMCYYDKILVNVAAYVPYLLA